MNRANSMPHFSFDTAGAKEKFAKENAVRGFRHVATGDQGSAFGIRNLLKKVDQNFLSRLVRTNQTEYSCLAIT